MSALFFFLGSSFNVAVYLNLWGAEDGERGEFLGKGEIPSLRGTLSEFRGLSGFCQEIVYLGIWS